MRFLAPILTAALAANFATSANAADLPYKARPSVPPVYSWTGFYGGVNVGGGIGVDSNNQSATFNSIALGVNGLLTGGTNSLALTGWVAGAQAGFNWQVAPMLVLGVEGDYDWTSQKGSINNSTPPSAVLGFFGAGANGFGYSLVTQQKLTEIATARVRAGVLIHDSLWYLTGGAAWGTVKNNYTFTGSANPVIFPAALQPGPFLATTGNFSNSKTGWTIGTGVETRLGGGWSAKLEYLYIDLGNVTDVLPIPINPAFGAAFVNGGGAGMTSTLHVTDNIIRAGLNYTFN
jgi:outer membrane immunogenic protein